MVCRQIMVGEGPNWICVVPFPFKEVDRLGCASSVVHQADQACRRLVSQAMQGARGQSMVTCTFCLLAGRLCALRDALSGLIPSGSEFDPEHLM